MIVTAVERQRRRVKVFIDGRFALAVGLELAVERDIRPGCSLTNEDLSALAEAEARRRALEFALRLLSYRPRSEREIRDRLKRRWFSRPVINGTVDRLRELGYVDDAAFARYWAESRQALRPQSGRLLAVELRRQGVDKETVLQATADISEEDAAYEAAARRLKALRGLERQPFRERLGRFLTRRGFAYDVARRTIERCWAELEDRRPDNSAK